MNKQDFAEAIVTHLRDFAVNILIADREQVTASAKTLAALIGDALYGPTETTLAVAPSPALLALCRLRVAAIDAAEVVDDAGETSANARAIGLRLRAALAAVEPHLPPIEQDLWLAEEARQHRAAHPEQYGAPESEGNGNA